MDYFGLPAACDRLLNGFAAGGGGGSRVAVLGFDTCYGSSVGRQSAVDRVLVDLARRCCFAGSRLARLRARSDG